MAAPATVLATAGSPAPAALRPAPPIMRASGEPHLAVRLHLRELTALFDAALHRKRRAADGDGAYINALAQTLLIDSEAAARVEIVEASTEIVDRERAARERVAVRRDTRDGRKARGGARCDHKFLRLAAVDAAKDAAEEARFAADGKVLLNHERDTTELLRYRRELRRRQILHDMQGVQAAQVFLVSDEIRQRRNLEENEQRTLVALRETHTRDGLEAEGDAALDALLRDAEDLKQGAAGAAEAARRAEKVAAEARKEQHRLIQKCTHSRNGKSVFAGAFPKKLCLICKVKLNPALGLLVPM